MRSSLPPGAATAAPPAVQRIAYSIMSASQAQRAIVSMNIYVNLYASSIDSSTQAKLDQMRIESFAWR